MQKYRLMDFCFIQWVTTIIIIILKLPDLINKNSFNLVSVSFWQASIIFFFLALPYFLAH